MKVLDDYIKSLNIFYKCIEYSTLHEYYNTVDIFVFGQMWITFPDDIMDRNNNIMFLNVEMLSEKNRIEQVIQLLRLNIPLLDYSLANINYMKLKIKELNINYKGTIMWLPYQFNHQENVYIKNTTNTFEYDVGIINAVIPNSKTNYNKLVYKRNIMWDMIKKKDWKYINILGWGKERDDIISKCKVIINVHNFDVFNVFEHIRCDRLLFANKIIVSDKSVWQTQLDIHDFVIWEDFDNIISKTQYILDNFNEFNKPYNNIYKIIDNRKKHLDNIMNALKIDKPNTVNDFRNYLQTI